MSINCLNFKSGEGGAGSLVGWLAGWMEAKWRERAKKRRESKSEREGDGGTEI